GVSGDPPGPRFAWLRAYAELRGQAAGPANAARDAGYDHVETPLLCLPPSGSGHADDDLLGKRTAASSLGCHCGGRAGHAGAARVLRLRDTAAGGVVWIPRYARAERARIWGDECRVRAWPAGEGAASEARGEAGMAPKEAAKAIRERADFNLAHIHEIEAEVR